jgi:hypothetical protein
MTKKQEEAGPVVLRPGGPHVHTAVCAVKDALDKGGGITKDRNAPVGAGGYNFRGIDDVYNVLCGLTAEKGLAMYPRVVEHSVAYQTTAKGGMQTHYHLVLEVDLVSVIDGSQHTIRSLGEAIDTGDKAAGKAQSYAMKMACLMAFMVPTHGEAMDTEAHVVQVAPPAPPAQQPKKPGPKKAAPSVDQVMPAEGVDVPSEVVAALIEKIGVVNTFAILHAHAQDAMASTDAAAKIALVNSIDQRARILFSECKSKEEVQEGFPLVSALGTPPELKRAANAAYARFR